MCNVQFAVLNTGQCVLCAEMVEFALYFLLLNAKSLDYFRVRVCVCAFIYVCVYVFVLLFMCVCTICAISLVVVTWGPIPYET